MIPVVTPKEMAAVDAAALEPVEALVARAGAAVAWAARRMLGGVYGRRVVVLAGKGLNGADGRVAARRLKAWGVRVVVIDAALIDTANLPTQLRGVDLVIDAAYGTGLSRPWTAPDLGAIPVLAVDIPSGVSGLTGEVPGTALTANETITFVAPKPGLLLHPGAAYAGKITVADIQLDLEPARPLNTHWVQPNDVASWLPSRGTTDHKWSSACWVVAGSPGMSGAAQLAAAAAARGGAGMVRLSVPGTNQGSELAVEVVGHRLPAEGWHEELSDLDRFRSLVIGPGIGRTAATQASVRAALAAAQMPVVVDADGLYALSKNIDLSARQAPTVLTPHDGEFKTLMGSAPSVNRIDDARACAKATAATVLLKGATTVIAHPDGQVLVVTAGDARLATAGTGDVLAGLIGALLACGLSGLHAAAAGAWIHGNAATSLPMRGMVAGDLLLQIPRVMGMMTEG